MKVLVVSHNFPRFAGDPAGAFVARLAGALGQRGVDVRAVVPHAAGLAEADTIEGVPVRRVRYGPDRWERVAYTGQLHRSAFSKPATALMLVPFLLALRRAVRQEAAQFQPDLIHAHWWFPGGWAALAAGRPVVVTCHGSDVRLLEHSRLARLLGRGVLRKAAAVTAVSQFLLDGVAAQSGPLRETLVTRMPIDLPVFEAGRAVAKADPPIVLYAGNLVPTKGVDTLLDAIGILVGRGIRVRLRILGQGGEEGRLRARAEQLGLGSVVEWSPFLPQQAMPAEYGRASVTVLPSRGGTEGLGLTLVEALAAGSAVVGTRSGGIPEVVEDELTGRLVPPDHPGALADALVSLLSNPGELARLTEQGQRRVSREYGVDAAVTTFLELFRRVAPD
ncbi:MAG: glycosyltransferase [Gemmatimonadales bacterium]|nr:glycosyltransferase [Gemmatimonadales bacterium]